MSKVIFYGGLGILLIIVVGSFILLLSTDSLQTLTLESSELTSSSSVNVLGGQIVKTPTKNYTIERPNFKTYYKQELVKETYGTWRLELVNDSVWVNNTEYGSIIIEEWQNTDIPEKYEIAWGKKKMYINATQYVCSLANNVIECDNKLDGNGNGKIQDGESGIKSIIVDNELQAKGFDFKSTEIDIDVKDQDVKLVTDLELLK